MKKFWGYASNNCYSVGCTGQTVYLFDKNGNEIKKFKDIIYGYTPMISPDGKIFVVKSTDGRLAIYSLGTFSLIKKFRFSKVDAAQDDGFCFSSNGKLFLNIERQRDSIHSAISVYDTTHFSMVSQLLIDDNMIISYIELDKETNEYFVLGVLHGDINDYFVAKYKDNSIMNITKISEDEFDFYHSYKHLEIMGFTETAYRWSYMDYALEEVKNMSCSLAKLFNRYDK